MFYVQIIGFLLLFLLNERYSMKITIDYSPQILGRLIFNKAMKTFIYKLIHTYIIIENECNLFKKN